MGGTQTDRSLHKNTLGMSAKNQYHLYCIPPEDDEKWPNFVTVLINIFIILHSKMSFVDSPSVTLLDNRM
jgi:hypothetical protein